MAQFGEQLCQGNIQARPVAEACKHCDFHDICGRINQEDVTDVKALFVGNLFMVLNFQSDLAIVSISPLSRSFLNL